MPASMQRDLDAATSSLNAWLTSRADITTATNLSIRGTHGGFTNEILFLTTELNGEERELVLRVQPQDFNIIYGAERFMPSEYQLMRVLSEQSDLPVPRVHWYEADSSWPGAPFFVMERVDGTDVPDAPPYWQSGWLRDASAHDQARAWDGTLQLLAKVNTFDWQAAGLDFLERDTPGLDARLRYYLDAFAWASAGEPNPIVTAANEWLRANRPADPEPVCLSWGDARLANVIFIDHEPAALLDWEMASLGPPLQDLAWWLFLDLCLQGDPHSGDPDVAVGLPGFPAREQTIARWGDLTGLSTANYAYYEVFAGFRFAVHLHRVGNLWKQFGIVPADSLFPTNNFATQNLAPLIGAEHPPPAPMPDLGAPAGAG